MDEFVTLLHEHGIRQLVDVRRFPRSRREPQFNQETLARVLPARGVAYFWMGEELGGFRSGGYERYTETPTFRRGLEQLARHTTAARTAIMCAEGAWQRCHRRFIARRMAAIGYQVRHIVNVRKPGCAEELPMDSG